MSLWLHKTEKLQRNRGNRGANYYDFMMGKGLYFKQHGLVLFKLTFRQIFKRLESIKKFISTYNFMLRLTELAILQV